VSDNWNDTAVEASGTASVTEISHVSWFERVKGALIGVLIGLLLIPLAIILLAWNEGRAIHTARSLAEGSRLVISVPVEQVAVANEGKLIHVAGPVRVVAELRDAEFGLRLPGAVKLRRQVEMFQWVEDQRSETQSKFGGGQETVTTYSYAQRWSSTAIDSSRFRDLRGHDNPPMRHRAQEETARSATMGAFILSAGVLQELNAFQPLASDLIPARPGASAIEGGLYLGRSPDAPMIGDMRITWAVVPAAEASVIGQQRGQEVAPFPTQAGNPLLLVANGLVTPSAMIDQAVQDNAIITWLLRLLGTALIYGGAILLLRPLVVLADIMPFMGAVAGLGVGLLALVIALLVAPVTIALAWLWFRPLMAFSLLSAVGLAAFFIMHRFARAPRSA